ncbi:MAG: hypothetical protein ACPG7U_04610 [Holosporaceae bacterium]
MSPITAIIPAIGLGWFLHKGTTAQRMADFLDGVRHRNIITMCLIYLLSGAFSEVTKCIGSVDSTVNFAMSLIPSDLLFASTIAGIAPLAVVPYVYCCYILAVVAVLYILLMRQPQKR